MFVVGDRRYQCRYNSCLNIGVTDVVLVVIVLVAVLIDLQFINVTKIILLFFFYSIILPSGFIIYINTLSLSVYSPIRGQVFIRTPLFRIRENPQFHRQNEINVTQAASYVPIYLQYTEHGTSLLHLRLFCSFYNVQHVSFFLSSFLLFPFRFSNV